MPIRLIDPKQPIPWVHPRERDSDGNPIPDATIFHIVAFTEGCSRRLRILLSSGNPTPVEMTSFMSGLLRESVVRIENVQMPGETTRRTLCTPGECAQFFEYLPAGYMDAIYQAVRDLNYLDEGTVKNFDGSHASPRS